MKKWIYGFLIVVAIVILAVAGFVYSNLHDRHPDYSVDIEKMAKDAHGEFQAGFAKMSITPEIVDTWTDVNDDAEYHEEDGDTYNDNNNNGKFDAFWIAGFDSYRAANGVHDDVWTRVAVFDDGNTRIAMLAIDAIGLMNDDIIDIREMVPESAGIDYLLVASTHTHESYDLMGIWGRPPFESGVNAEMMKYVKEQAVKSVVKAVKNLRPAKLAYAQNLTDADKYVKDTRLPIVKDSGLRMIQAIDAKTDKTLGVLVGWANHPETLWSRNLLISSDFPHYVREGIEKGVYQDTILRKEGLGGIAVFFNGAVGGLMAPHPSIPIEDPFTDTLYYKPGYDKTRALGYNLSLLALNALENPDTILENPAISLEAKTIELPIANTELTIATAIGLLDRGMPEWKKLRSEVAAFQIGPASFISIPGEIYPEIVNGGVTAEAGADFKIEPVEAPSLRELMPGKYKFVLCLSNDEIGYIIPKSQWDVEAPYSYKDKKQYGSQNSLGPETAPLIYKELSELLEELK